MLRWPDYQHSIQHDVRNQRITWHHWTGIWRCEYISSPVSFYWRFLSWIQYNMRWQYRKQLTQEKILAGNNKSTSWISSIPHTIGLVRIYFLPLPSFQKTCKLTSWQSWGYEVCELGEQTILAPWKLCKHCKRKKFHTWIFHFPCLFPVQRCPPVLHIVGHLQSWISSYHAHIV